MTKRKSINVAVIREVINRDKCKCQLCCKEGIQFIRFGKPAVVIPLEGSSVEPGDDYNERVASRFEFDHIKPVCFGGGNDIENIRLACPGCNSRRNYIHYLKEQGII